MRIYTLKREQYLPITMEKAWEFFSTPLNLNEMTPDDMAFEILTDVEGQKMYPGMIINYKVSPFPGVKVRWTTEITHVKDFKYFVDEQRFGPYSFWHHKHFFEEVEGGIKTVDIVDYGLPLGFLGTIAHEILVKNKLKNIFDFRYNKMKELFGTLEPATKQEA